MPTNPCQQVPVVVTDSEVPVLDVARDVEAPASIGLYLSRSCFGA